MSRADFTEEQLKAAVIAYAEALYAPEPEGVPEHVFSERYEERKRQNIELARKLDAKRRRRAAARKALRSVAAVFVILVISFAMIMTFSQTARAAVLNWFTETYNKIVYIRFNHVEDDHAVLICEPGALPEGFERTDVIHSGFYFKKTYRNNETGEYIKFEYYKPTEKQLAKMAKNGENAEKYLIFDYYEAYYTEASGKKKLCWYDPDRNLAYFVESDMRDKDALINAFTEITFRLSHYEPTWLPEGYEECERVDDDAFKIAYLDKENNKRIYYKEYDMADVYTIFIFKGVGENADDISQETISIGPMTVYYYPPTENERAADIVIIDDVNNLAFYCIAEVSREELIRIAKSIQCIESIW